MQHGQEPFCINRRNTFPDERRELLDIPFNLRRMQQDGRFSSNHFQATVAEKIIEYPDQLVFQLVGNALKF